MTPDRAAVRITGSGSSAGRGSTSGPGPSGRHATADGRHLTVRALGRREDEPLKEWLDYRDALAEWKAERFRPVQPGQHAVTCPNGEKPDHNCPFETRMVRGVLVRQSGVVVRGGAR